MIFHYTKAYVSILLKQANNFCATSTLQNNFLLQNLLLIHFCYKLKKRSCERLPQLLNRKTDLSPSHRKRKFEFYVILCMTSPICENSEKNFASTKLELSICFPKKQIKSPNAQQKTVLQLFPCTSLCNSSGSYIRKNHYQSIIAFSSKGNHSIPKGFNFIS